jgi:AcrR family transcriptional regulator
MKCRLVKQNVKQLYLLTYRPVGIDNKRHQMTEHQSKDARRDQILEAAAKLFVAQGYENSTVDQIAKEAGLSKGSIYWYFKSKLDILFELTDWYVSFSQQTLIQTADLSAYGTEALYKSHRVLRQLSLVHPERDQLLSQLFGLAGHYPEIRDRLATYHRNWEETAATLIQQAIDNGFFRSVNATHIAQSITALYNGLCLRKVTDADIDDIAIIETTTKLIYEALIIPQTAGMTAKVQTV